MKMKINDKEFKVKLIKIKSNGCVLIKIFNDIGESQTIGIIFKSGNFTFIRNSFTTLI